MRAGFFRTLWIMAISIVYIANFCIKIIWMGRKKKPDRMAMTKAVCIWSKKTLDAVKVKYKIVNPKKIEPKPNELTIILCNHVSLYDIPISFLVFPNHPIRMLAKKELSQLPLMGPALRASESPSVDRKNKHQAIKDMENTRKLLESGIVMWIAPEGTRSKDAKLKPFKKGPFIIAIEAKATIIPIGVRGTANILPAKTFQFSLNQSIEAHVGEPIDASQYTLENKEELMSKTHAAMKKLVGE